MSFENPPIIDKKTETQEEPFDFEKWLSFELEKQYEEKARILNRNGLLEILPESMEMGIVAIDGKEYPFPKKEEIKQAILENREMYETKMKQGFTELEIVPTGLPLEYIIERVKQAILRHHEQGKLFGRDEQGNAVPLELDKDQPLYVWNGYNNADMEGTLKYDVKEFSENHHGKTKFELMKSLPFPGYNVILREKNLTIPRQGKGKPIAGRKQIEAGKVFKEYLKIIQTDPQYKNEVFTSTEDWLVIFLENIEQTNEVIDNYQNNNDCVAVNANSCLAASGGVPGASWYRGNRQANLYWYDPEDFYSVYGVRPAVRVSRLNF